MDSSTAANSCTTSKPNITTEISQRLQSPVKTVFPTQTQRIFTCCDIKSKAFRTLSRANFCISVLILLGAIVVRSSHAIPAPTAGTRHLLHTREYREQRYQELLQQQRSSVQPTPHRHHVHHRSSGNMPQSGRNSEDENSGSDISDNCQLITKNIEKHINATLSQAKATYSKLSSAMEDYTQTKHDVPSENFYEQWKKHSLDLNHPYAEYLKPIKSFNIKPEHIKSGIHIWNKPLTIETLQSEFQHINQTLSSLLDIYNDIERSREANTSQIEQDLHRGNESWTITRDRAEKLKNLFLNVRNSLMQDIHHTIMIVDELQVPIKNDYKFTYDKNVQHLEWQLLLEHSAMMKYLVAMYTSIWEKCVKK